MKINIIPCKISTSFKTEKIYPKLEELTVIPGIEEQNYKGAYGEVTVKGVTADIDTEIKPENIKKEVNILGVDGGYEGIDTSDATATSEDILYPKTAYVNNELVEGTIEEYDGSFEGNVSEGIKITDASYLFYKKARTNSLNELLRLCENSTSTICMFYGCSNLTELDLSNFNTSEVNDMTNMFYGCSNLTELDLSNFNTSKVTNITEMFYGCSNLTKLDLSNFNTSKVFNMARTFYACSKLTELDLSNFNTSKVNDMTNMFQNCSKLVDLNLSSFDMGKITNVGYMFTSVKGLINLKSFKFLGKGYTQKSKNYNNYKLDLSSCTNLTHESLIDIIANGLYDLNLTYDVANGGTLYRQSLVLGATNLAKLTAEEIAIATNKGWDVT